VPSSQPGQIQTHSLQPTFKQGTPGMAQTPSFTQGAVGQSGSAILAPSPIASTGDRGLGGEGISSPAGQQQFQQPGQFDSMPLQSQLFPAAGPHAAWDQPYVAAPISGHIGGAADDALGTADSVASAPPAALDPWSAPVPVVTGLNMQFQPLQPSTVELQLHHSLLAQPSMQGQFELLLPQGNIGVTYDMGQDLTQVMLQGSTMSLVKQLKTMSASMGESLSELRGHTVNVTAI
jgi:hypothetical protein